MQSNYQLTDCDQKSTAPQCAVHVKKDQLLGVRAATGVGVAERRDDSVCSVCRCWAHRPRGRAKDDTGYNLARRESWRAGVDRKPQGCRDNAFCVHALYQVSTTTPIASTVAWGVL